MDMFLKQMQSVVEPVLKHLYLHIYVLDIFKYFPNVAHMFSLNLIYCTHIYANIIFDTQKNGLLKYEMWNIIHIDHRFETNILKNT
jgi:hypothetical protein